MLLLALASAAAEASLRSAPAFVDRGTGFPVPYTVVRRTSLRAAIPHPFVSLVAEPCAVKAGPIVFMTGNTFAAVSTDAGETFTFIDPATALPAVAGGFCCDQWVVYDPGRDLFIWALLYADDGRSNVIRLAVARGGQAVAAQQWILHDITPGDLRLPTGRLLDYPQLSLGANYLYLTTNVFKIGILGPFAEAVILRFPLDDLAAGITPRRDVSRTGDGHFTFTPVQGAGTTMYWAAHDPERFALRLYRWSEASPVVAFTDVPVSRYTRVEDVRGVCPGPDGRPWCGKADNRVQTGWVAAGVIGFMWNSPQGEGRPFPYVRAARIDERSRRLIDEPDLFSAEYALQYPAVSVNARGDVAGVVAFGGGNQHPAVAGFVHRAGAPLSWELVPLATGDSGPERDRWGDYFCVRPDYPDGRTWVLTGHTLRGGATAAFVHPHFVRFGLTQDVDCKTPDLCADDGNPCTAERCQSQVCTHLPRDGSSCDDGDLCTTGDVCQDTSCAPGAAALCSDTDPCTTSVCAATAGCVALLPAPTEALICRLEQGLGALAACQAETVPASVARPFGRAATLLRRDAQRAASATVLSRVRQRLDLARRRLERPRVRRRLTPGCTRAIDDRLVEIDVLLTQRVPEALRSAAEDQLAVKDGPFSVTHDRHLDRQ